MSALRFVVPMPPNMANARMHWAKKHKERTAYWARMNALLWTGSIPKPPHPTPAKAEIHARLVLGSQMDHDNAVARLKWPIDWLVANKYLTGDKPSQLAWQGFPEQVVRRGSEYYVEITITPL